MNHQTRQVAFTKLASDKCYSTVFSKEIAERLLDHLEPINLSPSIVVDVGCADGHALFPLQQYFPKAKVLGVDLNIAMLQRAHNKKRWWQKNKTYLQANAQCLPFAENSVDLIFSNLTLAWLDQPLTFFSEVQRVLKADGLFLFSSFGPGSFPELANTPLLTNKLADMHDIGDALMKANLLNPVMESETLTYEYDDQQQLQMDLVRSGIIADDAVLPGVELQTQFEVVYGHAWGSDIPAGVRRAVNGEVEVPIPNGRIF